MDFLLSFRLFKPFEHLKPHSRIKNADSYLERSAVMNTLLLTVDNSVWILLQIEGIFLRFMITTYVINFQVNVKVLQYHDYMSMALDIFFLIDYIFALLYRCKYPHKSTRPALLTTHLSRIVWRNEVYKPRKIWMLAIDSFSILPFELLRFVLPFSSFIRSVCYYVPAVRIYRLFFFYVFLKMDFLLSFRLFKPFEHLKPHSRIKNADSYLERSAVMNTLLLTVDNSVWILLQIEGIFLRFMITTYVINFQVNDKVLQYHDYMNMFLDIFFLIDYIFALLYRCKYPHKSKRPALLTTHLSRIVWRNDVYKPRKIWMLAIDSFSILPFELLRFVTPLKEDFRQFCYYVAALRIYRLFFFYLENMERIFLRNTMIIELVFKFFVVWLIVSHIFTCFYRYYAWMNNSEFLKDALATVTFDAENPFFWYMLIFYVIQFGFVNIGYGDIPPASDGERVLVIVVSLVGFSIFNGYIISALSNALKENIRRVYNLRFRLTLMKFEMERRKVPEEKIKKLIEFYHSLWTLRKGVGPTDEMLISLPSSIWGRVYYEIFGPALNSSLLFKSCDEISKEAIARVMQVELYMAGNVILRRSEVYSRLFYVRKGTVEIMSYQDDETQIMTFGAGSVFGQIALLLSLPARSEVHAATFCEIHVLERRRFFKQLADYPKTLEIVMNVHKNMLLNVMADKFGSESQSDDRKPGNVLQTNLFYKVPKETSKIARNDICVVNTCPYIYEPQTIFLKVWDVLVVIIIVVICFYYPYCAAFNRKYPVHTEPFIIIVDVILYINLYISLSTAVVKENTLFSSLHDIITSRLLNFSTYIDVFAILPLHYFLKNESRVKPFILCLRCLEMYKIHFLFNKAETSVEIKMVSLLRLIKYVLYFFFIGYIVGIIYYSEACYNEPCVPTSWYVTSVAAKTASSPVWLSLYCAILIVSGTGYGDVTPKNIQDVGFVTAFCLIGVFLFIYLIAEFSASLSLGRDPMQNFLDFAERVNLFLITHKMSPNEIIRVRQFLNLQWERNMGYEFSQNSELFHDTPRHLLVEISQYTKARGLENMPLFKDMSEEFLSEILTRTYRRVLPPHEVVIYAGEVCTDLIVIEEGFCEITYGKDVSLRKIVGAGHYLCTVEVMMDLTSMCHVRTLTHCTLLKVTKADLIGAFALNPLAASEVEQSIAEFKQNPILKETLKTRPIRLHLVVRSSARKSLYRFRYFRKRGGNQELKEPYMKLGLCQWVRFFLGRATILPYGKLLKLWELSRCFFAFSSAMLFPLLPYFQLEVPALYYVGLFLDITAWIDLIHVCYYNNKKLLVSHPLWTTSHYVRGSFFLDFIFCFPFDRIMYRPVYDSEGYSLVTSFPIDILRALRILQIYRIPPTVNNWGVDFLSPPSLYRVVFMMAALSVIFLNFLTSVLLLTCVNYKVDQNGDYICQFEAVVKDHFTEVQNQFNFSTDPLIVYVVNFYWVSATAFSLGYGDITADTNELMIFVIFVVIISYLYFSYAIVVIASYLSSVNMNLTIYQKRMGQLVKFLKSENVVPMLREHIINHFEYTWKKDKGMKAQAVFKNFSTALHNDVLLYLYESTLKGVGAFANVDPSFIRILSNQVNETNFILGAGIYKNKDIISELYIIHQGEVTLVGKNEYETIVLGPSQIFGLLDNIPRGFIGNSAVATKNVTVLSIKTVILYKLLMKYTMVNEESPSETEKKLKKTLIESNEIISNDAAKKQFQHNRAENSFVYWSYKYYKYILIFYLILSWFSINEVSYSAAFQSYNTAFICVIVPVEILFIFKVYLGFTTGFIDEAGDFISDARQIRRRYMRFTGFYIDLITVIPFEVFAFAFDKKDRIYAVSLLRVTKYLRVHNIQYFFNLKFDTLSVNMVLMKMIAVIVWVVTLLHQCTCVWYFISCYRTYCPDSYTWTLILQGEHQNIYINSMYFVVAVLTATGLGDVTPHTVIEFFFVEILSGFAFFQTAIFIGQIISAIHKYLLTKTNYEYAVRGLKTYLNINEITIETQENVLRYIGNLWRNEKGQQIPELLKAAPPYLIHEIKQSTYGYHINKNPIFKTCDPFFRKQLINQLYRTVFFPGDVIVHEGQVNRQMYFVHLGLVGCKDFRTKVTKIYGQNTFFGFKQGVLQREPHTKTYTAMTLTIILSLELKHWVFLKDFYPEDVKKIEKETEEDKWP